MTAAPHLQAEGRVADGPILELVDVSTHFHTPRGVVRAVDGVTMSVNRGRAVGIVGESGSGKTILSRSIMGLLPHRGVTRSGSIRFEGIELVGRPRSAMRGLWGKEMAMIFQDPMTSLNPLMRIGEQIMEPLRLHLGETRAQARATAERLLADVRIPSPAERLRQYPYELSGGMRQRVMIAIAMACGPSALFADEPTTALDVTVQAQILELLGEQRRERNMTMLLVTHDLGVVAGHTDEIAVMYGGKLVERAPTARLFANIHMPYTEALLRSIPATGNPPHTRLHTIPGRPPDLVNPPDGCRFAPRCAYAQDRCRTEEPPLVASAGDREHWYACWYPLGTPSTRRATEASS
ncbi:MAG: ABC transporter ATP-binding protein [Ilumatobacteraceae bacterium]|jgi:oligopeptide/dipeptide ABC transporter ATP-binding protein